MGKKLLLNGLFLFCCFFQTFAQQKTVTGKVTSTDGTPLVGATVLLVGHKTGVTTVSDGSFSINVPQNAKELQISYVGSETKTVDISSISNVSVSLANATTNLTDVVVVGYGTVKKKDATGSVSQLNSKEFNKGVIATPDELLQGRISGVNVTPASGEPGSAATITIRGTASIRDQGPLYVVDGVPISPGGTLATQSGVEGSSTARNPLSFLNPNDIASITVLKDASSAAIYGSRGANGVILITTKSGASGRGSLTFGASTGISTTASRYDLLNSQDFLLAVKKANIDAGTDPAAAAQAVLNVDKGYNTNWQDQIFRTGVSQNYNLAWGISHESTNLRLSGSYDDIQGTVKNSGLKRYTGRLNLTQKFINDKLRFDVNVTYSNVKGTYAPLTNNAGYQGSLIGAAITFNPTYPIYNPDGSFYDPLDGNRNPAEMLTYFSDKDNYNRFLGNVSGSYTIIPGLVYKATFGYDDATTDRTSFADPRLGSNAFGGTTNVFGKDLSNPITVNGRGVKQNLDLKTILVEHTLTYDKSFTNQDFNAVVGYSYQSTESNYKGKVGWGLSTPVTGPKDVFSKNFGQFTNYYDYVPNYTKYDLQSYFGRLNYTLYDKYLLTATMRIDGSSKFGVNNKYGYFPAFAAKWKLLKEKFAAKTLGNIFSEFAIRANYGILGSSEGIGAYDAIDLKQTYIGNSGNEETVFVHQGNKNLKWEQAATTGVGLDFAILNNRLSGTFDYYYTKRKDLLYYAPTPGGFSAQSFYWVNLPGYVINKGTEYSLNYKAIKRNNFTWTIDYNMTFVHNTVQNFNVVVNTGAVHGQGLSGAYAQTFANGYPLFTWKMPTFLGFDGNGDARYANGGKDELQGSALPKFLAGLTNSFTLGRWNASVFVNTVRGFYIYNNTANALFLRGSIKTAHNITYDIANSAEDPINPGSVSTRFLEKGNFVRISNASIGYNFNIKSHVIKTLSVSASGQNLALFTKYSGLDPEVNLDENINGVPSRGFDYAGYPKSRTYTLSVNVGF
jgi:TonB-linked SusC/RagA family outer membrane protein